MKWFWQALYGSIVGLVVAVVFSYLLIKFVM